MNNNNLLHGDGTETTLKLSRREWATKMWIIASPWKKGWDNARWWWERTTIMSTWFTLLWAIPCHAIIILHISSPQTTKKKQRVSAKKGKTFSAPRTLTRHTSMTILRMFHEIMRSTIWARQDGLTLWNFERPREKFHIFRRRCLLFLLFHSLQCALAELKKKKKMKKTQRALTADIYTECELKVSTRNEIFSQHFQSIRDVNV